MRTGFRSKTASLVFTLLRRPAVEGVFTAIAIGCLTGNQHKRWSATISQESKSPKLELSGIDRLRPNAGNQLSFEYEYDFGDGWQHEIVFEDRLKCEKGKCYPICLECANACPPEDVVGSVGGYADYLEALADPKHEQHDDWREW